MLLAFPLQVQLDLKLAQAVQAVRLFFLLQSDVLCNLFQLDMTLYMVY